jgi:hypothetical protein
MDIERHIIKKYCHLCKKKNCADISENFDVSALDLKKPLTL